MAIGFDDADIMRQVNGAVGEVLADVGELLTRRVYEAAPKRTGALAKSIRYVVNPGELEVKVVVDEFYSAFIEFGFRHRTGAKRKIRGKGGNPSRIGYTKLSREQIARGEFSQVPARPFLRPAVAAAMPEVVELVQSRLES